MPRRKVRSGAGNDGLCPDGRVAHLEGAALDGSALAALFASEETRLRSSLRRRLGNADDAADIVQDAFTRLIQAQPVGLRAPKAYLQRIVRNLLRDRFKRAEHLVTHSEAADESPCVAVPPEQEWGIEARDLMKGYAAALETLTPRTREVFLLHRVDELRYREIAERLGISVATVEYHIARALVHLDRELDR